MHKRIKKMETGASIGNIIDLDMMKQLGLRLGDYNTFMNSFMNQDNTGFFTRKYAKEHPYISVLGNIGGDILTGVALNKGYNTIKNNINKKRNLF